MTMIRYEVETPHKTFVGCESTIEDAKDYIATLIKNGVTIIKVEYFDKDRRVADINEGRV